MEITMKKAFLLSICLAFVGYTGFRAYSAYADKSSQNNEMTYGRMPSAASPASGSMRVPLVESAVATEGALSESVQLVGSLRPIAEVQVMSKISGRVEQVLVDVGDPVRAGQLIAIVEDREIRQQLQQAEASLAVTQASIRQREAELQNYQRQVQRFQELFDQSLISRQELEDVTTRKQTAQAQLQLSRAQFRQSEAMLNQYKINLENTRSYAPMDGLVSNRSLHPGALVSSNTPIVSLVDLSILRVVVNLVEKDVVRVRRGDRADVSVDAFPGRAFSGEVRRVSPVLDPATRTGEVEIQVANGALDLRAEMFARVSLELGSQSRKIVIPREAMVYQGNQGGVFVLEGNVAHFRPIRTGAAQQTMVEIVDGLEKGEEVVTIGASLLKDGDRVRLRSKAESPSPAGL
jgi:RND family efflux transporter MFP subunit